MTRHRLLDELIWRFERDFPNYQIEWYISPYCDIRLSHPFKDIRIVIRVIEQAPPFEGHLRVIANEYSNLTMLSNNEFYIDPIGHIYYH